MLTFHMYLLLTNAGFLKQGKVEIISLISGNCDAIHQRLLANVLSNRSFIVAVFGPRFSVASSNCLTRQS